MDLSEPLELFAFKTIQYTNAVANSLEAQMTLTSERDLLELACEVIGSIICEGAYYSGIGYGDIFDLKRFADIRYALHDEDETEMVYQPKPNPTQQFHLNVFEDQTSRVLATFYGDHAADIKRTDAADITLWQTLTRLVITMAGAAVHVGLEHQLTPMQLMAYHIESIEAYGLAPYTYVMTLSGP